MFILLSLVLSGADQVATVRVVVDGRGLGSGVVFRSGNPSYILTCAHVVGSLTEWVMDTMPDHVEIFVDGKNYRGTVISTDIKRDLAIISVPVSLVWRDLAKEVVLGETIRLQGYGPPSGPLRYVMGIVKSKGNFVFGIKSGTAAFEITAAPVLGDSGGPIVNMKGKVVGILSEGNDSRSEYLSIDARELCDFVDSIFRKPPYVVINPPTKVPSCPPPAVATATIPSSSLPSTGSTWEPVKPLDLEVIISRIDVLEGKPPIDLGPITSRIDSLENSGLTEPSPTLVIGDTQGSAEGSKIPWGWLATGAASVAGIGLPIWAIWAFRGARAIRRRRTRRAAPKSDSVVETREIIVDAPQAPGRTRIDTQFINVESDHYQRAHEQARQQVVRRYPGSQEILEAELSLTRQYAAGMPEQ